MSVTEREALDFSMLLSKTCDLSDAMLRSKEMADFLYWKERMEQDPEVKALLRKMSRAKERFEECERFGHYHPNYHEALDAVKAVEAEMEGIESAREFKRAEKALDALLYDVSVVIAHAVSESIKVPSNDPLPKHGGSCGSGGSCGCG
ncbi:YlbF family regulator [Paenibacillus sp.]|uniref:YlbF family regulator n=1 Tax=Paenibacillus sp. TaxID=58172 RepID=UPI002810B4E8|nr:YlbF family regulator [Paenibacillus sp.]